jgi:hypothetical protein
MAKLVDPSLIENIVGVRRHPTAHYARVDAATQIVYILHSQKCVQSTPDLRDCYYSLVLDRGINDRDWKGNLNRPVVAGVSNDRLVPVPDGEWER